MNNTLIQESIKKEKIQLNLFQTLEHYRTAIILLFVVIMSFTNGLKTFAFSNLDSINISICIIFMILSLTSFLYQMNRLKLISIETKQNNLPVIESITELAKQWNWKIELVEKNALVINTNRPFGTGRVFLSKSGGEKIYVFFKPNKILFRSIFDLKRVFGLIVSSGENHENEKRILERIKASC